MKKKKKPVAPLVTSMSTTIRNHEYDNGTQVTTPEQTIQRKKRFLKVLDKAISQIEENLTNGNMKLIDSIDIERVVKLTLLVSGEADSISGKSDVKETVSTAEAEASKLAESIDENDTDIKAMFDRMFATFNEQNNKE